MKVILEGKYIIRILFMICSTLVWSQHTISGSVMDKENIPIAYANLLLLKAIDSVFVSGTSSNDFGDFKFENITDTGTEGTKVASGTTAQRGSTVGQIRFNSTTGLAEYYTGTEYFMIYFYYF